MNKHEFEPRLSREEAAEYLGVSAKTLSNWATSGRYDLRFIKVGRRVIYLKSDLDAFMAKGDSQPNKAA